MNERFEPRWNVSEVEDYTHREFFAVVRKVGKGAEEFFEPFTIGFGQDAQLSEEVEAGGWDPISGDERAGPEGLGFVMDVVNDPVHDLWRNPEPHRRRSKPGRSGSEGLGSGRRLERCPAAIAFRLLTRSGMRAPFGKLVWLGALVFSTAAISIASDSQVAIDSLRKQPQHESGFPTFDSTEHIVDQWVEDGRQFITRNGQTCTYLRLERLKISDIKPPICVHTSTPTNRS